MADNIGGKEITSLPENTAAADEDIMLVGNAGTANLRRITFANIVKAVKGKIANWAFETLTTTDKTLSGAINETNDKISRLYPITLNEPFDANTLIGDVNEDRVYQWYTDVGKGSKNLPEGVTGAVMRVIRVTSSVRQILYNNTGVYYRSGSINGQTLSLNNVWAKQFSTEEPYAAIGSGVAYKEKNGYIFIVGESSSVEISANAYTKVATLPEGKRPDKNIPFIADCAGGSAAIFGRITTDGSIKLYSSLKTTYWNFSVIFPVV